MELGYFTPSLAVKDLAKTIEFYGHLGFEVECGGPEDKWAMLKAGDTRIGVFEGMFPADQLCFNPPDARAIEAKLREAGVEIDSPTTPGEGLCSLIVKDPDGRTLLFDQLPVSMPPG